MDRESNYISLQDATKFCDYTQEYLSLRARQGKLKALKFGRNWVTKEDWLKEYLGKVEEYENHMPRLAKRDESNRVQIKHSFFLKPIFSLGLFFILFVANVALGTEGLSQVFATADPFVLKIAENSDQTLKKVFLASRSLFGEGWNSGKTIFTFGKEGAGIVFSDIIIKTKGGLIGIDFGSSEEINLFLTSAKASAAEVAETAGKNLRDYFFWLESGYISASNFIEEKISDFGR
jgi:hypothetical protein